jgi:DNA mismatch repair protein MutS
MSFTVDKQTLDDLNMAGRYNGTSIFSLFNHTHTRGGEQLLESMFRQPLSDAEAINARSSIFQYFQAGNIAFPIGKELCEAVEQYRSAVGSSNVAGASLSIGRKKLLRMIGADKEYDTIHAGILSMIEFLHALHGFFTQLNAGENKHPYLAAIREVKQVLDSAGLQKVLAEQGATELPFLKVIQYDHLLRYRHQQELDRVMQLLYETDVYITVARIARERKFIHACANPFVEGANRIEMINVAHPQLPGAVANSVHTDYDRNLIFLTGANMAGKSTFMKSFGIALYLAHMGFPVAAERMTFSVQDGLFTSINVPDNLNMGYSHFYAEVLRVKQVAEAVSDSKNLVIIFDELFKGTNVKDAYDATVAVTEAFGENRNCTFIVSTHIVEAGEVLRERCSNMQFVYFPTIMDKQVPRYTYQLQEGISADRHGMMIIANEGIVDIISGKALA